jgi:hypothetical protein
MCSNHTNYSLKAFDYKSDPCNPKLIIESIYGCPVWTASSWVVLVSNHPWYIAILLIIVGGYTAFRG